MMSGIPSPGPQAFLLSPAGPGTLHLERHHMTKTTPLRRYIRGEYYQAIGFAIGAFIVWASVEISEFINFALGL